MLYITYNVFIYKFKLQKKTHSPNDVQAMLQIETFANFTLGIFIIFTNQIPEVTICGGRFFDQREIRTTLSDETDGI